MAGATARIYHCPACGGPCGNQRADRCEFCSGPLLPLGTPDPRHAVRCGACAALVGGGASYCPQCGDPLARAASTPAAHGCPGCPEGAMEAFALQPTPLRPQGWSVFGCRGCGGVWVDTETLGAMLASAAKEGSGDGRPGGVERRQLRMQGAVVYRPCAVCQQTMHRRNFARISGVIVDECREHGTFFDAGELEDILAFVRSGGMLLARRRENDELERERRRAELHAATQHRSALMTEVDPVTGMPSSEFAEDFDLGFAFLGWAGRWIRNMFR